MNIKKIGLTALAGSLVATTAFAGELSLSGGAKFAYKNTEAKNVASHFSMDQEITASGSAELDNGMTVSVSHGLATGGSGSDTSTLTLDMGDMGKLAYSDTDISGGLKALDDLAPSAYEEVWDGLTGSVAAAMGNGAGFSWGSSIGGAAVSIMYSDNSGATTNRSDGSEDTTAAGASSSSSIGIQYPVADTGLTVFGGVGTEGQADSTEIDHNTIGVKYAYGPVTVGYQVTEIEGNTATNTDEATYYGVTYAITDSFSVGYGESSIDLGSSTTDQETSNLSFSYTMGGMTLAGAFIDQENSGGSTAAVNDRKGYEFDLAFAF